MVSIEHAREFAVRQHEKTGCEYDGKPYETHLAMVVGFGQQHLHLLTKHDPPGDIEHCPRVIAALWLHDTIEDTRNTYNDIKLEFGEDVADLVYGVTNELGRNRWERLLRTLPKVRERRDTRFMKCCDLMGNIAYSKMTGSSMFKKYQQEYPAFRAALRIGGDFDKLWEDLDALVEYRA